MKKMRLGLILRFSISLSLLGALVWMMRKSLADVFGLCRSARIDIFMLGIGFYLLSVLLVSWRLRSILSVQAIILPLKEVIKLNFVGIFFNNFLPTSIGGDIVKAYYTGAQTGRRFASYTAIVVDRLIGLVSFVFIATAALIMISSGLADKKIAWIIWTIFIGTSVFLFLFLYPRLGHKVVAFLSTVERLHKGIKGKLVRLYNEISAYRQYPLIALQSFLISICAQIVAIVSLYCLSLSIDSPISLVNFFTRMPIISTMSMLPSLNGLGIRESGFVYFFRTIVSAQEALAISLLWLGMLIVGSMIGGIIFLWMNLDIKEVGYMPKV